MIWIVAALILGIFLNMSTVAGTSWPIGSIIAVVIMGIYIKINQDKRFDELKSILDDKNTRDKQDISANDDCTHEES